jgi:AhpD family alkylhydroperoxidase
MGNRVEEFLAYRERMHERIFEFDHLGLKRFFNLDSAAYREGSALDRKTKELLALVASSVLRCNECIDHHIVGCLEAGWREEEILDALNIAVLIGGSIVIPHLRHAVETLDIVRGRAGSAGDE